MHPRDCLFLQDCDNDDFQVFSSRKIYREEKYYKISHCRKFHLGSSAIVTAALKYFLHFSTLATGNSKDFQI